MGTHTMTGGTIRNNRATGGHGGGVCVAGKAGSGATLATESKFTMTGGTISGNSASQSGGGVYINSDDVELRGGYITNNTAGNHGGGVYVSEPPQLGSIYNAVVTGNTASVMGGGMWFCPTGDATLSVTNGVALYGNKAQGSTSGSAGDDFASLIGSTGRVTLADRMLGGGAVEWYRDGGVKSQGTTPYSDDVGTVDTTVSRFDPQNPGERITEISTADGNYALKAVVSQEAIALAQSQAKLWITGNSASRGGGIGSNGAAQMGEPNREYTLKVTKQWSSDTPENQKAEVTVYLKIGDYQLDAVTLSKDNDWTAEFTGLPDPATLGGLQYAVVESPVPEGFVPAYSAAQVDEDSKLITITVTNTKSEEETPPPSPGVYPGGLTVAKMVYGNDADLTKSFVFTVALSDPSINGLYGDMFFTNGVAVFVLSHGQTKTAVGLPAGTRYTVAESGSDGYTVLASGAVGWIPSGQTATAVFENYKNIVIEEDEEETEEGTPQAELR